MFNSSASNLVSNTPNFTVLAYEHFAADNAPEPTFDFAAPKLSTFSMAPNPKPVAHAATLSVKATDNAIVQRVEYYLGIDPGLGNGIALTLGSNNIYSTSITDNLSPGVYLIGLRAVDNSGNWSDLIQEYLVVNDATGLSVSGRRSVVPSLASGDVLPGLIASSQTDQAIFGLNVQYASSGTIANNSNFKFSYTTGSGCNSQSAVNCHSTVIQSLSVSWLSMGGANNATATFSGSASVTVDGVTTANPFTAQATDASLAGLGSDHLVLYVYPVGSNPSTATPIYRLSDNLAQGNIKVL